MDLENTGANLTIDWSLSDALTLTSVTGYQDFSRFHVEDRDATSLIMLDGTFDNQIDQFSEEVRLTHVGDNLVLIGGAFYGEDSVDTRDEFLATDLLALLGLAGVDVIGNEYQQDTTSMALFLHSEWSFSENWKLTAGARYTDESKDFAGAYTFLIAGGTEIPLYPDVVDELQHGQRVREDRPRLHRHRGHAALREREPRLQVRRLPGTAQLRPGGPAALRRRRPCSPTRSA